MSPVTTPLTATLPSVEFAEPVSWAVGPSS
jgi:hypothetical protein